MKFFKNLTAFLMLIAYPSIDASFGKSLYLQSKNISKVALATAGCMMASQKPAECELLIVKKEKQGLTSLAERDIKQHGPAISKTLLKYQWPMCTSQNLTEVEKQELLITDKPCAEELFIQSKLKQELGVENFDPEVIFIPTTLYELFCINYIKSHGERIASSYEELNTFHNDKSRKLNLTSILNLDENAQAVHQRIHQVFHDVNMHYFDDKNLTLDCNQACIKMLFQEYPELKDCENALQASKIIQEKSQELSIILSKNLIEIKNHSAIVKKYIKTEYEAREQNKALLVRGTTSLHNINFEIKNLSDENLGCISLSENKIKRYINKKNLEPYSLSFGNSLFAGYFNDQPACAYFFLKKSNWDRNNDPVAGYSLFVNKDEYMKNRNSQLFFIPSLTTVASLMSSGEYFHPRSTAAQYIKTGEKEFIGGLYNEMIKDPAEILFIQRDPWLHSELFYTYFANNGKIIHRVDDADLTEKDKTDAQQILLKHQQAAELYKKKRLQDASVWAYVISYFM